MNKNAWLASAALILFLAAGLYYFFRDEPLPLPEAAAPSTDAAVVTFTGTDFNEEENGKKIWNLAADKIEADNAHQRVIFHNARGIFYRENDGRINLTATKAVLHTDTKDIELEGNIRAVSSTDGAVFTTPRALWKAQDKKFWGYDGITLTRGDTVVTGQEIEADTGLEKVIVRGKARVKKGGENP
ncbi:MAG TPA: LPS export ABC transporter periplasmic protein LptC [Patescibacteria group bacterium]|nr:LPS export ABC transporter periplasmic protein LptC [Patescibacteria group bacterium]